jgi:hypothetical protein
MPKDNIEQKQHLIDLMNMENKEALALVEKYKFSLRGFTLGNYEANQCAKLDLTNRIEMLESLQNKCIGAFSITINDEIQSLKQQLEYLNNL